MKLWGKAALRGSIPLVVVSGIAASLAAQDKASDARGTLTVGVIVASVMAASVIYDVEAWTLKRQTIVHFMVMALTVFPALCLSGWFPTQTAGDIMVIGGYFLVAGLVSWVLAYCVFGILVPRIQKRGSRSAALNSGSGHPKRAVDCQKVLGRVGCGNLCFLRSLIAGPDSLGFACIAIYR